MSNMRLARFACLVILACGCAPQQSTSSFVSEFLRIRSGKLLGAMMAFDPIEVDFQEARAIQELSNAPTDVIAESFASIDANRHENDLEKNPANYVLATLILTLAYEASDDQDWWDDMKWGQLKGILRAGGMFSLDHNMEQPGSWPWIQQGGGWRVRRFFVNGNGFWPRQLSPLLAEYEGKFRRRDSN